MEKNVTPNKIDWAHPLSPWELKYIKTFRDSSTPKSIQMHEPVNPDNLTDEQVSIAQNDFQNLNFRELFANYETRRLIVAHYVITHPATIKLQLSLYRFARDINPIHFSLERGWQIGCGREMFTNIPKSELGVAAEFFVYLAAEWLIGKALRMDRINSPKRKNGTLDDDANFAQKDYRNDFSKEEGARFSGWTVDQVAKFLRAGTLHPRHIPIDYIVRDGNVLILNTRSSKALELAGIPRSQ